MSLVNNLLDNAEAPQVSQSPDFHMQKDFQHSLMFLPEVSTKVCENLPDIPDNLRAIPLKELMNLNTLYEKAAGNAKALMLQIGVWSKITNSKMKERKEKLKRTSGNKKFMDYDSDLMYQELEKTALTYTIQSSEAEIKFEIYKSRRDALGRELTFRYRELYKNNYGGGQSQVKDFEL